MPDNYLVHHGIKGQKWGVRRYQNPDGTLTDAGYARYGLHRDGSIKTKAGKTENTMRRARRGAIIGTLAGAAAFGSAAASAGIVPTAAAITALGAQAVGSISTGAMLGYTRGYIYGRIDTKLGQRYIQKQLAEGNDKIKLSELDPWLAAKESRRYQK